MSSSTSARSRLERYTIMASVPTVGIMGSTALAAGGDGFNHYGGPAIHIERGNFESGTEGSGDHFWSRSYGSAELPSASIAGYNHRVYENFGDGKTSWEITNARLIDKTETQALGFGCTAEDSFGRRLAEGHVIDGQGSSFIGGDIVVASTQDISSFSNNGITRNGDWALVDGEEDAEVRGYLAWNFEVSGVTGYGWIDIGWDGDVLTIYDYAANQLGSIEAGQTSSSTAVPGAGGLAALAMGAAGLRRRRKKSA